MNDINTFMGKTMKLFLCFLITLSLFTFIFNYESEKKEIDKKFLNMLKSITNLERNAP